ncbi:MAG: hypothetical protein Q7S61_02975 [bacterium]|nr:hypothetical protein [bacterium]
MNGNTNNISLIGLSQHEEMTGRKVPHLRYIKHVFFILKEPVQEVGGHWQDLYQKVKSFNNSTELSDSVHDVLQAWIENKVSPLKKSVHSLRQLTNKSLVEAILEGWLSTDIHDRQGNPISLNGQRRGVLLATMSHIIRKVETTMYVNILKKASSNDLEKLGLDESLKKLTVDLLTTSLKTDPLFVRFLTYTQVSSTKTKQTTTETLYITENEPYSIRTFFPRETKLLARHFQKLAQEGGDWVKKPGGGDFQKYLNVVGQYYAAIDHQESSRLRGEANALYKQCLKAGFPIILTGDNDEIMRSPNRDPEIKVSVRTREAKEEENRWEKMKHAFASSLEDIEAQNQKASVTDQLIIGSVVFGSYGINSIFSTVAQENPTIQIFLDTQARAYDRGFPNEWLKKYISGTAKAFIKLSDSQATGLMECMSRTNTVLHELSHWVFGEDSKETLRFENGPTNRTMQEVKAETLYRALIPQMLQKEALEGTLEQWAMGTCATSLQILKDNSGDWNDDYFLGAVFSLNDLLDKDIVTIVNNQLHIQDVQKYFVTMQEQAKEIVALHQNSEMNETKAKEWIKQRCQPNDALKKILKMIE